ncbi:MAG: FHA domain-containing protein [Lachnospiraceae bacterium]|nr:FHA domain-containing protein [Lachnospiraceae bacterium]
MIKRCNQGHWYDGNTNKTCPVCKLESEKLSIRLNDLEEDDKTISITEVDLSLGEELGAIIGNSINNLTQPPEASVSEDGDKTISFGFFGVTAMQPVTGWLVCLTGDERGKDFRLHSGKNFIGRSTSMDVMLVDDKTIARDKHGSVVYDPKGNTFYVSAEGGNTVYLNQEIIHAPEKLAEGDEITIGETVLRFVPFCKEDMKWEKE